MWTRSRIFEYSNLTENQVITTPNDDTDGSYENYAAYYKPYAYLTSGKVTITTQLKNEAGTLVDMGRREVNGGEELVLLMPCDAFVITGIEGSPTLRIMYLDN